MQLEFKIQQYPCLIILFAIFNIEKNQQTLSHPLFEIVYNSRDVTQVITIWIGLVNMPVFPMYRKGKLEKKASCLKYIYTRPIWNNLEQIL